MIDENRLAWIEAYPPVKLALREGETAELIRLARLGLWAGEHGIPTLKKWYHDDSGMGACSAAFSINAECTCSARYAHKALAALPKP